MFKEDTTNVEKIGWMVDNMIYGLRHNCDWDKINNNDEVFSEMSNKLYEIDTILKKFEKF